MKFHFSRHNNNSAIVDNYHAENQQETQKAVEIQNWLISYISDLLLIPTQEIDVTIPFDRYGLDSAAAYELSGDLETWLARELDPTLVYNYPTIETLTHHLIEELKVKE